MKKYSNEQFIQAVKDNKSYAGVMKQLGILPIGGNYNTVKKKIAELNLDISHFTGKGWNVGLKFKPKQAQSLSEILVESSNYQSYKLLRRLLKEEVKERVCENCGSSKWLGNPIPLELHHINGIHTDNRLENLQVLCPNCHALTDNYRGKNTKKSAQMETSEVEPG